MTFQLADGIAVLELTPPTLRALLAGLPEAWITVTDGPNTFSPFDNVGHLIHGERTDWIPVPGSSLPRARTAASSPMTPRVALRERDLALEGEHPELGPVTLRQLLAAWVAHHLGHVAQTARVMQGRGRPVARLPARDGPLTSPDARLHHSPRALDDFSRVFHALVGRTTTV